MKSEQLTDKCLLHLPSTSFQLNQKKWKNEKRMHQQMGLVINLISSHRKNEKRIYQIQFIPIPKIVPFTRSREWDILSEKWRK